MDGHVETACDALADRDLDPDAAVRALQDAKAIVRAEPESPPSAT